MWRTHALVTVALFVTTASLSGAVAPAAQPPAALTSKLQWRSVGPFIGGRVVAVAGVAGHANLFYMGGVDSGVWESTDYGLSWKNLTDGKLPGSNSIGAIAVAPSDERVIYAGTGEGDIRGDMITGDGLYKSTDAGKSWQYAGLRDTHTIASIVVDPTDARIVYAASMGHVFKNNTDRGVFKSLDGGKNWARVLFTNTATGAIDLAIDPQSPSTLYAAMWEANRKPWKLTSGGPHSGLYKSTDAGAHWSNLSSNPGFAPGLLGRIGVSVAASDPRIVYAIVQAKEGGVFRSADAGATWTRVNSEWKLRQRAFYYMSVFADPTDPQTVYAPEVDALWVSHDGGKTFAKLRTPHGDNHVVWIDPRNPRVLLEGNDGGATVSTNGGKTWSSERNQPTGQFYHVALDSRFPFHLYGAQQDEGSIEGPSAGLRGRIASEDWHAAAYGESTFVAPDPSNPDVTFGSGYFSILMRLDQPLGELRDVSPYPFYQEGASSGELKYRFGWTHPVLFSPANPKELLIAAQYVLASEDGGVSWTRISPDLTRNDPETQGPSGGPIDLDQSSAEVFPDVSALAVSPLDGRLLWAGSADGLVHVTTDAGTHWQDVTPPDLPQWSQISSIEASRAANGTAYLTASRYMFDDFHPYAYRTTDYGRTWTAITAGVADDEYAFTIREDPSEPNLLLLGTKTTVYASYDRGARWQALGLNLPHVQVRDIAIDARQGDVVVATHGRAFWILDNLALLEQLAKAPPADAESVRIFAPQTAWLTYAYGGSGDATGAGANPPFGASVFFNLPPNYDGTTPVSLAFFDAHGAAIRSFVLHRQGPKPEHRGDEYAPVRDKADALAQSTGVAAGMNRFQWDLAYPPAAEVTGYNPPIAAGGLPDEVDGPKVVPGRYTVVLDFAGRKTEQAFEVALDPRLHASADDLAARLALALDVSRTLDALDRALDEAIAARDRLAETASAHAAVATLDELIARDVDLEAKSSEAALLHEARLRDHLAYLQAEVELAYVKPTPAQYAVFEPLKQRAEKDVAQLQAAIAAATR